MFIKTNESGDFMMRKKMLAIIIGGVVLSMGMTGYAKTVPAQSQEEAIRPLMQYINSATVGLKITSSGEAQVRSYITGHSSLVTKVKMEVSLQQYKNSKWTTIDSWSQTDYDYLGTLGETSQVTKGYKYRVVTKFTAYSGSSSETQTVTSSEVSY